ncbi:MAG: DNA internalization-related competence protein ComEC/Rec2 [Pseudomonadales bacterium]|nr:DNA internalization-related competence protein ComEC/Rec2 [Pseudomonadales bacterium]
MRAWMIAFAIGILLAALSPVLPGMKMLILLAALVFCLHLPLYAASKLPLLCLISLLCLAGAGAGYVVAAISGRSYLDQRLPAQLEAMDFWVSGQIVSLPRKSDRATQFEFRVNSSCLAFDPKACAQGNEQISFFDERKILLNHYAADIELLPGQVWFLRVRLNRPHGLLNAGGFDYELSLMQRGIHARGYVRDTVFNILLQEAHSGVLYQRYRLQQKLLNAIESLPYHGLVLALILGERNWMPRAVRDLFAATGTSHLLVISGLHVGFVAVIGYWLGRVLVSLFPPMLRRFPAQKYGALAAIAAALMYSLLAGFSLPTQRASIMTTVAMMAMLSARRIPVSFSWLLALTLVLLHSPLSILSAGLWLSFLATGALLLVFVPANSYRLDTTAGQHLVYRFWQQWGRPQWVVSLALMVPLAIWMQSFTLLAPVANLVAVPLVGFLVVPLCLMGTLLLLLGGWSWGLLLADKVLAGLVAFLSLLDSCCGALLHWQFSGFNMLNLAFASVACLLLLLPPAWPGRRVAWLLLLPLFQPLPAARPLQGELWVTVLDVGQGLSVILQTRQHTLVYDAGPARSEFFDSGRDVLVPWLAHQGVRGIDALVISHGDNDHAGGVDSLLALKPVAMVWAGTPRARSSPCRRGIHWSWDEVSFEFLHPGPDRRYNSNEGSCVLRVTTAGSAVLLPGDISAAVERQLVADYGDKLQSTLLLAPHHGSKSSSTRAFIDAVAPRHVVFSAGYRNQFGHPAGEIQQRYRDAQVNTWTTASSGMLSFRLGRTANPEQTLPAPEQLRQGSKRFWR